LEALEARAPRPGELGAEAAELVEAVSLLEVSQELGQIVVAEKLRLRLYDVHTRGLEDVDDPFRDVMADLEVAARACELEARMAIVQLQPEIRSRQHDVSTGGAGGSDDGIAHAFDGRKRRRRGVALSSHFASNLYKFRVFP
jgi:hypothetical protein